MMFWTKPLSMQQMLPTNRLTQLSSLHSHSRESPTTLLCLILPVLPQVSGTGRSKSLMGRSPCPCLCWVPKTALQVTEACGKGTIILVPEFTRSQSLPAWLPPFPSLTSIGAVSASSLQLGRAVSALVVQCLERHVVCWPPPTASWCLLQTPLPVHASCKCRLVLVAPERGPRGHFSAWPVELHLPMGAHAGYRPLNCLWTPLGTPQCAHHYRNQLCPQKTVCLHFCKICCLWGLTVSWSIKQCKLQ